MPFLTATEKLWFPGFVLVFQLFMLILFGVLVEYDQFGAPVPNNSSTVPDTNGGIGHFYPLFQDVHVMIFIGFGFLMTFLRRYGYGSIGFNMLLAALVLQWATLTNGILGFIDISEQREHGVDSELPFKIQVGIQSMIGSDFAAAAVLITFGAVLGRASPFQMLIIAVLECIFYSANEALNINVLKASDAGGSMIIHTFGAYFGLAVSVMLYRKKASCHDMNSSSYRSDLFAMIGSLFLWLFWPSFNAALLSGDGRYRAIVNTYYSLSGSVLMSFVMSIFFSGKKRKIDMVHIQNATLAGGVAVGACADMVIEPWGALLIGCLSGVLSVLGYSFLSPIMDRWLYLQDTCGVHNLHGLPGVMSGIGAAVAASVARKVDTADNQVEYGDSLYTVFAARAPEARVAGDDTSCDLTPAELLLGVTCGEGRSGPEQAGYQLALVACTLLISIIGGLVTGFIARLPLFQATGDDKLFDDNAYWHLPDDADCSLPQSFRDIDKKNADSSLVAMPPGDAKPAFLARDRQGSITSKDTKM